MTYNIYRKHEIYQESSRFNAFKKMTVLSLIRENVPPLKTQRIMRRCESRGWDVVAIPTGKARQLYGTKKYIEI